MKTPRITIEIAATCAKCGFAEWKHYRIGDVWHCALFQETLKDIHGYHVAEIGLKDACRPCDNCARLVRHYEELPEVDPK